MKLPFRKIVMDPLSLAISQYVFEHGKNPPGLRRFTYHRDDGTGFIIICSDRHYMLHPKSHSPDDTLGIIIGQNYVPSDDVFADRTLEFEEKGLTGRLTHVNIGSSGISHSINLFPEHLDNWTAYHMNEFYRQIKQKIADSLGIQTESIKTA